MNYVQQIFRVLTTMIFLLLPGMFLEVRTAQGRDVVLSWDRPDDERVQGYEIYYGPAGSDFTAAPGRSIDTADQTSCTIYNLAEGSTYGFALRSIDAAGNASPLSQTVYYPVDEESGGSDSGCWIITCRGDQAQPDRALRLWISANLPGGGAASGQVRFRRRAGRLPFSTPVIP